MTIDISTCSAWNNRRSSVIRIRFLLVTMTCRFSNFNSISYTEDQHVLFVTGTKWPVIERLRDRALNLALTLLLGELIYKYKEIYVSDLGGLYSRGLYLRDIYLVGASTRAFRVSSDENICAWVILRMGGLGGCFWPSLFNFKTSRAIDMKLWSKMNNYKKFQLYIFLEKSYPFVCVLWRHQVWKIESNIIIYKFIF